MRKYFLLPVLFILMFSAVHAQKLSVVVNYVTSNGPVDKSLIFYDGKTKLTWDDFQGKPDNSVDFAAQTSAGSGFNFEMHGGDDGATMITTVFCSFSKPESWVKADKESDYLLLHEQHHFDLAYIYTQLFIQKLKTADLTEKNYQKVIGKIFTDCQKGLDEEQAKYDDETQHSIIKAKQEEWNKKVDDELAALKAAN
ncbi:MAG TPA: hypothetical protein VK559_13485 [Ferruginibacter sp.]|nr:hypothetical protein [Ferruginibacter sp.]